MGDAVARFTDEELKAVVGLLAGPGMVWELKFGSWVLIQPERINAYAQAVIQTMREDEHERGCSDSYLTKRKSDGAEIFRIEKPRHIRYWMDQAFPMLLVIRNSKGEVRWMEVRDWLKNATENGTKNVWQIVFEGERFDVMSVRRWRDRVLATTVP